VKLQKLPSCVVDVPEPLLRAADEAEKRKEAALDRLTGKLAEHLPPAAPLDNFGAAMEALIDAHKLAEQARGK
jgi:hypothetical protein